MPDVGLGDFSMTPITAGGCIPPSAICHLRNSNNCAGCNKRKANGTRLMMNSIALFIMMIFACSEDKATLESDLSAVAGGKPEPTIEYL